MQRCRNFLLYLIFAQDTFNLVLDEWEYRGCYNSWAANGFTKKTKLFHDNSPKKCGTVCLTDGYKYFSLANEVGEKCNCGNSLILEGRVPDNKCSVDCPGDKSKKCGAHTKWSYYEIKTSCNKSGYNFNQLFQIQSNSLNL